MYIRACDRMISYIRTSELTVLESPQTRHADMLTLLDLSPVSGAVDLIQTSVYVRMYIRTPRMQTTIILIRIRTRALHARTKYPRGLSMGR